MGAAVVQLIGRSMGLAVRLATVWPSAAVSKRRAKACFARELRRCGLGAEETAELTKAYADMISLNPSTYLRSFRRRGNRGRGGSRRHAEQVHG